MLVRTADYHKNFRCLAGACPDTCCRDWEIIPDPADLEDYRSAPSPLREQLETCLTENGEGERCFGLREDGFCALLTEDGLCPIQRDWGEEHLCTHCKAYPRFTEEYGCLSETALAISCPEAARLLVEAEDFRLVEEDDGGTEEPFPGVDAGMLAGLEYTRAQALDALNEESLPIWQRLAQVLALADDAQDCLDFGAYEALGDCQLLPVEGEKKVSPRLLTAKLMETCAALECLRPAWPELLTRCSQRLYDCKEGAYAALRARFEQACPRWERILANLACYLVYRHWHKSVNDDGLYGRAALAGAACLLIYHLCLLEWEEKESLPSERVVALLCAFSREVEHMEENLADLIELFFDSREWPLLSALCTLS